MKNTPMAFHPDIINQVIEKRRSVFQQQYSGKKVDETVIQQILLNANWAPTHKLTEPWRFVVFADGGIQKLAEFQSNLYKEVTTAKGTFQEEKYQGLLTKPHLSSHIIAVGMKRDAKKAVPEIEELGAVYCAIENMYLTATGYGVGCYFSTGGITYWEEAKPFFNLGPEDKLIGFLHVGIPKGDLPPGKRKPVSDKTSWVR